MKKLISKLFMLSNIEQKIKETCSGDEIYSGWANKLGCIPTTNFSIPVDMYGLSGVITIAEGTYHSAALKEDGTVWTWGVNWFGQLGNSTTSDNEMPTMVENISKISTISVGKNHTVALKNDGTVWAWGSNLYGQLGNGSNAIQKKHRLW